jgi:serine/threonine-protein kinase
MHGREVFPWSWSGDGKSLVVEVAASATGENSDIGVLSMEGDHTIRLILREKYSEFQPRISPDGKRIAYTSNESGKNEVYIRLFPKVEEGRWQVSTSGGDSPLWSPDGRELFYLNGDAVMAVPVITERGFGLETPQVLFRGTFVPASSVVGDRNPWDISPDGKRFLMMKESTSDTSKGPVPRPQINIVLNWTEELKQRVPTK